MDNMLSYHRISTRIKHEKKYILKILHFSNKKMTSSHTKKKTKTKTTKLRGCEMNQLEMTVDESLQSKH
jgi:hypothetical protein